MDRLISCIRLKTTFDFDGDPREASVDDTDEHMDDHMDVYMDVHKEGLVQASH